MKKYLLLIISFLALFTSCVDEKEYPNTPEGNFEALWKIIDERYCFFDYKHEAYGLDWQNVSHIYKGLILCGFYIIEAVLLVYKKRK